MPETIQISPSADLIGVNHYPSIGVEIDGVKADLPNLNDSRIPIDLLPAILTLLGKNKLSAPETMQVAAGFTAYLQENFPDLWGVIRRQDEPLSWLMELIRVWAEQSQVDDPKASSSGGSSPSTGRRSGRTGKNATA